MLGSNTGKDGGKHQELINRLYHPTPEVADAAVRVTSKLLSTKLSALKARRVTADYFIDQDVSQLDQENASALAQEILDKLT